MTSARSIDLPVSRVIRNLETCSTEELQKQVGYLETTPVQGVAKLLRERRCTLEKGFVRSLVQLGALKTEFGRIGSFVPRSSEGDRKFRVAEVLPLLRSHPGTDDELQKKIEAFIDKDKRREIEYNITILSYADDLIVKDGNKRTVAFYESRKETSNDNIEFPVFVIQLAG